MRMTVDQRRSVIITAALRIARERGLSAVNQGDVAKRCVVATSEKTVRHYFACRADLWSAVVATDVTFTEQARELGAVL